MLRLACALLLALAAVPSSTHAQDATTAESTGGEDAEARGLFTAGEVAFREGRFENALDYFRRAYALSHRPGLLYNIGASCDRLRRDAEALEAFEQYLRELPEAANRREVEARITVLRESIARASASAAPSEPAMAHPPEPPLVEPAPSDTNVGAWVIVGTGGAAAIGGVILLAIAGADVSAVEGAPDGTMWSAVADAYGRSEAESIAGAVLLGAGSAAAIAGIVWAALPRESAVRVEIAPTAGGILVRGTL